MLITGPLGHIGSELLNTLKKFKNLKKLYLIDSARYNNLNVLFNLKNRNIKIKFIYGNLLDKKILNQINDKIDVVIHLAAQAGVRYSLENPRAYIESNIVGTFNIMEAARKNSIKHLLMASTSSVYGANQNMPFDECDKADTQLTIYAATKKANENMAHSYAYLHKYI